ncbi:MAG: PorT family protein [Flavobacteriales bacterium]|nr:PorT family protein [Flavobacteriales bacterium]
MINRFLAEMKKLVNIILPILFIASMPLQIYGQKHPKLQNLPRYDNKKIHFGFTMGINSMDFKIKQVANISDFDSLYVLEAQNQKGFNLGIVSNLRLGKAFDLRFLPRLVFSERIIEYSFLDNNKKIYMQTKPIESTFIDFPILIKYKSARYNNFRTYLIGGIKYGMDIASQKDIDDEGDKVVKLKRNDLGIEVGFGMDFYLEYFKFSPQIKLTYGILNLLSNDETVYTKSVEKLTTNAWMLSFTFE